jgi:hypothetical protein
MVLRQGVLDQWREVDQIRRIGPFQEQHGVDVGGAHPGPEVKMGLGDLRVPVIRSSDQLSLRHLLSLVYEHLG